MDELLKEKERKFSTLSPNLVFAKAKFPKSVTSPNAYLLKETPSRNLKDLHKLPSSAAQKRVISANLELNNAMASG